jgi:hypothetical protein
MRALIRVLCLTLLCYATALPAVAQPQSVGEKQQLANEAFEALTQRMQKLKVALQSSDPEKAQVIALGAKFIEEKALGLKMNEIKDLLDDQLWDDAIDTCKSVIKDLNTLIDLLLKGDTRIEDILKEIERLEKIKDKVDKLIKDQKQEKEASARAEDLSEHLKNLEKAKEDLKALIEDQKNLREEANSSGLAVEPNKAKEMASQESGLKDRAEKLAEDLKKIEKDAADMQAKPSDGKPSDGKPSDGKPSDGKPSDGKPSDGKPSDGKPSDGKPSDGKPSDGKPSDGKPSDGKPSDGKPSDGKPSDGKPSDGKPSDGKPSDGKPSDGKPSDGKPSDGKPSNSAAAGSASGDMGKAQSKLEDNKPESSLEDMEEALKKLEKAEKDLANQIDEAKRELQKLPFEKLANEQEKTKVDTDNLAKEMEKSEAGEEGKGPGKPTPGKQSVQQAVPKQKSAAGQLKEYKPGKAKQDQQDAQDKLEDAKKKLEEALAQLRQQLQDEVLRSLEERFADMLAKQKKISARTRVIERQRKELATASGQLSGTLVKRIGTLATGEFELAAEAHASLKLLEEDGSTAVFPDFVIEVRDDLKKVGRRLQKTTTNTATQAMQKEVEDMLEMLIDALRKQIEQNEQNGGEP